MTVLTIKRVAITADQPTAFGGAGQRRSHGPKLMATSDEERRPRIARTAEMEDEIQDRPAKCPGDQPSDKFLACRLEDSQGVWRAMSPLMSSFRGSSSGTAEYRSSGARNAGRRDRSHESRV
jgi:hypothetical protein